MHVSTPAEILPFGQQFARLLVELFLTHTSSNHTSIYSLICSEFHPFVHLSTHPFIHPLICPCIHLPIPLCIFLCTHQPIYLLIHPLTIHSSTYSPTLHLSVHPTHPPIHPSSIYSVNHPLIQSTIHYSLIPLFITHSPPTHPSIYHLSTFIHLHIGHPSTTYQSIYYIIYIYIMLYISIIYTHPFIYGGGVTTIHPSTHAPIIYPPIAKYTHSPIYPSTQPSIYSSMHYSFIHLLIHLSIYSSTHLAMCSYINPLIYPSPICPSDHLSTSTLPSIYSADPSLHLLVDSSILPSFICLHPPSTHPYPSSLHIASQNTSFWALANCVPDPRGNSTSLVVLDTETQAVRGHNFLREESREGGGWGMSLGSVFL